MNKNNAMALAESILFKCEMDFAKTDAEARSLDAEYNILHDNFMKRHSGDRELIKEVLELLNAQCMSQNYICDYRVFAALELGIGLGSIKFLPNVD